MTPKGMVVTAAALRVRANQLTPPYSVRAIALEVFPDALITGRPLPNGVHEIVTLTDQGPLIMYHRALPTCDQRIAIGHALGHLIRDVAYGRLTGFADPFVERRADDFSCELLAPIEEIDRHVTDYPRHADWIETQIHLDTVDELAAKFHVPQWVVNRQIATLMQRYVADRIVLSVSC